MCVLLFILLNEKDAEMTFNKIRRMQTILFYERRVNEFNLPILPKLRLGEERELHYKDIGGISTRERGRC